MGDASGNFTDQQGRAVYRESGLGDQGQIFRFPDERVFVDWNDPVAGDDDNPTAPFTTDDYDATALLRCKAPGEDEFGNCPAGISRMEDKQRSLPRLVLEPLPRQPG